MLTLCAPEGSIHHISGSTKKHANSAVMMVTDVKCHELLLPYVQETVSL